MAQTTARALVVTRHGGPNVLSVQDRDVGSPGPGEVLVRLAACGVNFVDIYLREGVYPGRPPFTNGSEGAGVVVAVGTGVEDFAVSDVVAWAQVPGSASTLVRAPAESLVHVPAGVGAELAAACMLQGLTAHYLVNSTFAVRAGDAVLVHAAAGGVGQLLVQLAKAKGAVVTGTVSTAEKAAKARALGADHVIDYSRVDDVAAAAREATGGRGMSVVYDGVGADTFDASLDALQPRGTLVLFGAASGQVPPFDVQRLNRGGSLFLTRPTLKDYLATREELTWRAGDVLDAVADGTLQIEIGGRYRFSEAARAYDDLKNRRTTGKLLLTPDDD